jgi:hypothetical protein
MRGGNWFLRWVLAIQFMAALAVVEQSRAAAFQNLDFENVVLDPTLASNPYDLPSVIDVPGWSFSHATQLSLLWHIGSTPQQFLYSDLLSDAFGYPVAPPLEGHYSLAMGLGYSNALCGWDGNACVWAAPWIEQTGNIPAGTKSIRLLSDLDPLSFRELPGLENATALHVFLDGIEIPLEELPSGQLTGDAAAFAGTASTLRIQLDVDYLFLAPGPIEMLHLFDAIEFTPAPEPASAALIAFGMLGVVVVQRRRQR